MWKTCLLPASEKRKLSKPDEISDERVFDVLISPKFENWSNKRRGRELASADVNTYNIGII